MQPTMPCSSACSAVVFPSQRLSRIGLGISGLAGVAVPEALNPKPPEARAVRLKLTIEDPFVTLPHQRFATVWL